MVVVGSRGMGVVGHGVQEQVREPVTGEVNRARHLAGIDQPGGINTQCRGFALQIGTGVRRRLFQL